MNTTHKHPPSPHGDKSLVDLAMLRIPPQSGGIRNIARQLHSARSLALVVIAALFVNSPAAHAQTTPPPAADPACNPARTITVTGSATVVALPDYAVLTFTFSERAKTAGAALSTLKNSTLLLRDAMQQAGVASRDINTDDFAFGPIEYGYRSQSRGSYGTTAEPAQEQTEFVVHSRVDVTVRNINRISELIDLGVASGANGLEGVQMLDSRLRAHRDEARLLAVKAAGEKAALMSGASGAKLGCVLTINETSQGWWWNGNAANATQNVSQAAPEGGAGDALISGAINARADVSVVYALY
jgi:uncharacterized protein